MGLLDKLWDDTVAGPRPERGLGKLRRYDSVPNTITSQPIRYEDVPISRAITILKTNSNSRTFPTDSSSTPSSPAGSSTADADSPLTPGTPKWDVKRLMRRKSTSAALERAEPRSPTVYDWVVISAIDR